MNDNHRTCTYASSSPGILIFPNSIVPYDVFPVLISTRSRSILNDVSSESESEDALDHILSNIRSAYSRGLRETGRTGYMREMNYVPLIVSIPMSPTLLDSGLDLLLDI